MKLGLEGCPLAAQRLSSRCQLVLQHRILGRQVIARAAQVLLSSCGLSSPVISIRSAHSFIGKLFGTQLIACTAAAGALSKQHGLTWETQVMCVR